MGCLALTASLEDSDGMLRLPSPSQNLKQSIEALLHAEETIMQHQVAKLK